jgi:RNA polymerase sigma factor (sigma-70 family)
VNACRRDGRASPPLLGKRRAAREAALFLRHGQRAHTHCSLRALLAPPLRGTPPAPRAAPPAREMSARGRACSRSLAAPLGGCSGGARCARAASARHVRHVHVPCRAGGTLIALERAPSAPHGAHRLVWGAGSAVDGGLTRQAREPRASRRRAGDAVSPPPPSAPSPDAAEAGAGAQPAPEPDVQLRLPRYSLGPLVGIGAAADARPGRATRVARERAQSPRGAPHAPPLEQALRRGTGQPRGSMLRRRNGAASAPADGAPGAPSGTARAASAARKPRGAARDAPIAGVRLLSAGGVLSAAEEAALAQQLLCGQRLERVRESLRGERTAQRLRSTEALGALAAASVAPLRGEPSDAEVARACGLRSVAALREAAACGRAARDALVAHNMGLVWQAAARFRARSKLGAEDLVQEGAAGLLRATQKFNPERGYRFSTYAYRWVDAACRRAVQNEGRTVRIPVWLYEVQSKLFAARAALRRAGVPAPSPQQLAAEARLPLARVAAAEVWTVAEMSLDEVVGSDARPVAVVDTIAADAADAPGAYAEQLAEADVTRDLMRVDLEDVLHTLLDKERFVLRAHFGMVSTPPPWRRARRSASTHTRTLTHAPACRAVCVSRTVWGPRRRARLRRA